VINKSNSTRLNEFSAFTQKQSNYLQISKLIGASFAYQTWY